MEVLDKRKKDKIGKPFGEIKIGQTFFAFCSNGNLGSLWLKIDDDGCTCSRVFDLNNNRLSHFPFNKRVLPVKVKMTIYENGEY